MIYLNDIPVNTTIFPDKTSQVWKVDNIKCPHETTIRWVYENEAEFMQLAQLVYLVDEVNPDIYRILSIDYLPYARQDKPITNDATFALRVFADLLNYLNFSKVILHDPHSPASLQFIHNSVATYPTEEVAQVIQATKTDLVCYPDHGALTKYSPMYPYEYIYGEKVREQSTGRITNYKLVGNPLGKKVLIVDDLCDGGMTFKILTKDLLAAGAIEVNLFVSHGIFSQGLTTLTEAGINRIFTKNGEALEDYLK